MSILKPISVLFFPNTKVPTLANFFRKLPLVSLSFILFEERQMCPVSLSPRLPILLPRNAVPIFPPLYHEVKIANLKICHNMKYLCEYKYFSAFSPVLHRTSMIQTSYHSSARQRGTWKSGDEKGSAAETFSRKVSWTRRESLEIIPRQKCSEYDWKSAIFWLAPFNVDLAGGLVDGGRVPRHLAWVSNLSMCTSPLLHLDFFLFVNHPFFCRLKLFTLACFYQIASFCNKSLIPQTSFQRIEK